MSKITAYQCDCCHVIETGLWEIKKGHLKLDLCEDCWEGLQKDLIQEGEKRDKMGVYDG